MCSRTNCSMRSSKISVFVFALMPPISHLAANSATQGVNSYAAGVVACLEIWPAASLTWATGRKSLSR
jgi:hypothetical protein